MINKYEIKKWEENLDEEGSKYLAGVKSKFFTSTVLASLFALMIGLGSGIYLERHKNEDRFKENHPKQSLEIKTNLPEPLSRTEKLNQTCWYIIDSDGDGGLDQLRKPGIPIYNAGQGDSVGEYALDVARKLVNYKNDFAGMAGSDKEFYWLCRVDDFDEDGSADKISWPRMGDKMPIYEKPFPKGVQEKADEVVLFENYILDYISKGGKK